MSTTCNLTALRQTPSSRHLDVRRPPDRAPPPCTLPVHAAARHNALRRKRCRPPHATTRCAGSAACLRTLPRAAQEALRGVAPLLRQLQLRHDAAHELRVTLKELRAQPLALERRQVLLVPRRRCRQGGLSKCDSGCDRGDRVAIGTSLVVSMACDAAARDTACGCMSGGGAGVPGPRLIKRTTLSRGRRRRRSSMQGMPSAGRAHSSSASPAMASSIKCACSRESPSMSTFEKTGARCASASSAACRSPVTFFIHTSVLPRRRRAAPWASLASWAALAPSRMDLICSSLHAQLEQAEGLGVRREPARTAPHVPAAACDVRGMLHWAACWRAQA